VSSATQARTRALPARAQRLRPGQLRQMVADHLATHPTLSFTPAELSNLLRRSSGAISNACVILCAQGIAAQVKQQPKTYATANTRDSRKRRTK
jgi:nitric oxide reductase NorQ protein